MVKTNKNYIVAILIIAVLTLSLFVSAVAVFAGKNSAHDSHIHAPSPMTNIDIKDENGTVDAPVTSGGTPISTADGLKAFLRGNDSMGYLTNNIAGFKWDKLWNDVAGMSNIEFAADRVLDGNGYTVTVGLDNTTTDNYPMITKASAVEMWWVDGVKSSAGASSGMMYASSFLIAINQGTIKNLNMDVDITKATHLEWIPSGRRNSSQSGDTRNANSKPLFFGFMTGVNFGYISNSTINYKKNQPLSISNANESSSMRWGKEDVNDMEFGGFAGVNCGEISYVTGKFNNKIDIQSRSSSKDLTLVGANSGNSNARAIFGGLVGRMQSDPDAGQNKAKITTALLTNSIITGNGEAYIHSTRNGSGGVLYNHVGAAVGSNSPYSGTVVNPSRRQSYGIIDGIISSYTGSLTKSGMGGWETAGSTSGATPSQTYRAIVDCGKISNVTFADAYDGHIDNCSCVGGEHIATRANGIKTSYGDGSLTMSFSRTETSNAALIFEVKTKSAAAGKVDDNVIFAITKNDRAVKDGNNMTKGSSVALFNYDTESYYSQFAEGVLQTSKHAIIEVIEPRAAKDENSFILELEFGTQVKAMYETSTVGQYISRDEKLGRDMATFPYSGSEKGSAKIVSLQDGAGEDSFEENLRYRQFKSKFRSENQEVEDAQDYTMDLIYPGIYTDIYIQASISSKHAYIDPQLRFIAPLEKSSTGAIVTKEFKITPTHIVTKNDSNNVVIGGEGADKDDIDTIKLFANTYAHFDFEFSIFAIGQSGDRQELKKTISGSGANQVVTYPYDRIEYSDDGYIYKTALTYAQYEAGEKFIVNTSTHPVNGRNYYFRAVKELRDSDGKKMENIITLESKNYKLKIDGEAPIISAKIVGGSNAGINFLNWSERNAWKKAAFTLAFNVDEATLDNLSFYQKVANTADDKGELVTLDEKTVNIEFSDDKVYVLYAFDKYGNRSTDYTVASKIDAVSPEFDLSADLKSYSTGGIMTVDDVAATEKTIVNSKVVSDRTLNLTIDFTSIGASGATAYYKINNSDWILLSSGTIALTKVVNSTYYNNDGSVDKSVYDHISVKVISGSGVEVVSDVEYEIQVNKGVILVDKDTVTTSDGFIVTQGIRREHLTKTYTSNNALSEGLVSILNRAINEELYNKYGEARTSDNKVYVEGYYASANVGNDIDIILNVIDPLDVYTINANMLDLKGFIAPALINVTVHSATREYGRPNPKLTYAVSGLFGNDTIDISHFISVPESVTLSTPASNVGINLNVPKKGYLYGNYRIGEVNSINAKLYITPQELIEITYDDAYLDFEFNGEAHHVVGKYTMPDGTVKTLGVEYYDSLNQPLEGGAIDIGSYKAIFTISDPNYTLNPTRATITFEVHKGFVGIDVSEEQLNLKYNGEERMIKPVLSNGSTPKITYYTDTNILINDGEYGSYPISAGNYIIRVEYNNDIDVEAKRGKYFNNSVELIMTISKVKMAESGMTWKNVDKRYDGVLSQVIVSNIPLGTIIPDNLVPAEEEGSYILLQRTDVGEETKRYAFKNTNFIEQELVATIKIDKASFDDNKIKFDSLKVSFNNEFHSLKLLNLPVGVEVNVKTITGTTAGVEIEKPSYTVTRKEAGIYKVKIEVSNDNFVTKVLEAILTIEKGKLTTGKTEPVNVQYDGDAHYSIITGIPSDVNMDSKTSIQVNFAGDNGSSNQYFAAPVNAERTIWQTPSKVNSGIYTYRAIITNANYEVIFLDGIINIVKATYKQFGTSVDNIDVVYDGTEKVLKFNNIPDGTTYLDALGNPTSGIIRATDAGEYNLDVFLSNPNMMELDNHFKASLNIAAKQNPKQYVLEGTTADYEIGKVVEIVFDKQQLDPDFTVEFNQLTGMSVADNILSFVNAGRYNVIGYVVNKNFTPSRIVAEVVVNKILAPYIGEVTIDDQTVMYNGSQQALKVGGLKDSDGALVRIAYSGGMIIGGVPSNAGTYKASVVVSHINYIDIQKNVTFTITPAKIDGDGFTIDSASFIYDGNSHDVQVLDTRGVPISGYITRLTYGNLSLGELPINAGSYAVSGILTRPNYQDFELVNLGTLDIRKAVSPELTIRDVDAKYTGKSHKVTVLNANGETLDNYSIEIMKNGNVLKDGIVDAGEYSCTIVILQQNYTTKTININVKIAPKAVAVAYENVTAPIDGSNFVLKGTYKDSDGATQEVVFDFPEGFTGAPGKYTLGVKISNVNYVATEETASVTFEIKGSNVGAIVGGAGGGAAVVGVGAVLFFVLKKKKISL